MGKIDADEVDGYGASCGGRTMAAMGEQKQQAKKRERESKGNKKSS